MGDTSRGPAYLTERYFVNINTVQSLADNNINKLFHSECLEIGDKILPSHLVESGCELQTIDTAGIGWIS